MSLQQTVYFSISNFLYKLTQSSVHAVQHLILQANRQMEDDEIERIAMDVFQFFPALQHLKSLFGEILNSYS